MPDLAPPPDYAHVAVSAGRLVHTAGAVPLDEAGALVARGDPEEQIPRAIENLLTALDWAGA